MIPDIQLQLKAVAKSLKDNVLPAIDPANELAQQQIQLSIATLEIALHNLPAIHAVLRKDIQQHVKMAMEMRETLDKEIDRQTLAALIDSAEQALANPALGPVQLQQQARDLRSGIGDIIAANPDATALETIVLAHSDATIMLGRALNKPMGFEPSAEDVAEISSLLARG